MRETTNIDSFFNKNNNFDQLRKAYNGTYDDRKKKNNESFLDGISEEELKNAVT